jgi:YHS domain-containing protein
MRIILAVLFAVFVSGSTAYSADQPAKPEVKPYPLKTCVVGGDDLDEDSPETVYKGQQFKFCCKRCMKQFEKDPDKYLKKMEEKAAAPKDEKAKANPNQGTP